MSSQNLVEIIVDIRNALNNIKNLSTNLNNFITQAVQPISVKFDGTAITNGIKDVENKIKETAEQAQKTIMQNVGDIGFAINAITSGIRVAGGIFSPLITASNEQEKALSSLTAALGPLNEVTSQNIYAYTKFATEMQRTTNTADEQVLSMLALSTTMGISESKRTAAVKGAIGLSKSFAAAGLSLETAMKGIALAYEGDFSQLQRYIPLLREASTETEKMTILQDAMTQGLQMAESEVNTGAGALLRLTNTLGDFRELVGDLIKFQLEPLVNAMSAIVGWLNKGGVVTQFFTWAIGSLTAAIVANTIATKAGLYAKIQATLAASGLTLANVGLAKTFKMLTVETLKWVGAMIASPLGYVILGISLLTMAISGVIKLFKWWRESTDEQKKANNEFAVSSTNATNVLLSNSQKLMAQYKEEIKELNEYYTQRVKELWANFAETAKIRDLTAKDVALRKEAELALEKEYYEKTKPIRQKIVYEQISILEELRKATISEQQQIEQATQEHLGKLDDLLKAGILTAKEHADDKLLIEKNKNTELRKIYYNERQARVEIAKQQVELNEITHDQYKTIVTNYYNWVEKQYGKDTREYLDALRMKVDLTKQALADMQAIQKRFVSKEDTLAEQYKRDKEVLENTKALNENYLADLDALYRDYNQARIDLRQKEADDKKRLNEESKSTEKQLLEDSLTLAEKRVQVTGEGYEKLTQAANAYLQYCKLAYGEDSVEFYDAMQRNQQAHATAIESMRSKTPSLQQAWQTTMDALAASAGAFAEMATGVLQGFVDGLGNAFADALVDGKNFGKAMEQMFKNLAKTAIAEITKILVQMALLKPLKLALGIPFASGGFVSGPGSGTSDSIPARLSNGEYVINAAKTRLFKPLLDVINYSPVPAIKKMFNDYAASIHLPQFAYATATPRLNYATGGVVTGGGFSFSGMEERLEQVINSVEHLTAQMTNQMERLNQKDYNVKVESVIDGVKLKRVFDKAQDDYKKAVLNG